MSSVSVSPRNFLFTAVPSINATLGEKLELKCSVDGRNSTSILESINVYSRGLGELNVSCSMIKNKSGECRYTIQKVQLRHRGSYDCIKIYKDQKCFSKTLQLSVSQRRTLTPLTEQSTTESIKRASYDQGTASAIFWAISFFQERSLTQQVIYTVPNFVTTAICKGWVKTVENSKQQEQIAMSKVG